MKRNLTLLSCIYWTTAFTAMAAAALLNSGPVVPSVFSLLAEPLALGLGYALAAVLFFWTFVVVLAADEHSGRDIEEVARLATTFAVAMLLFHLLGGLARGESAVPSTEDLALFIALTGTYLVIRLESQVRTAPARPKEDAQVAVARLHALDAAHGSLLNRLMAQDPTRSTAPMHNDRGQ